MTKFYYILGVVAVIGVGIVAYAVGSKALGTAATEPVDVEGLDDMSKLVSLAQGITKGDEKAPITIVEFGDYSCPSCAGFSLQVVPEVFKQLVETGKAKYVFYDFPLVSIHPHSFLAARAGRCADDQGKFWEYQDAAYRAQNSWALKTGDVTGDLTGFADQIGLDVGAFKQCLNSDAHADVVSANLQLGYELGVDATPTVMVSAGRGMARRLNDIGFNGIKTEVDRLVAEMDAAADSTAGGSGN
jgi:protein-disulfide isomerase